MKKRISMLSKSNNGNKLNADEIIFLSSLLGILITWWSSILGFIFWPKIGLVSAIIYAIFDIFIAISIKYEQKKMSLFLFMVSTLILLIPLALIIIVKFAICQHVF